MNIAQKDLFCQNKITMKNYKEEQKYISVLENVICDKCKKRIGDDSYVQGATIKICFDYGSKYDGDLHEVDLCDDCSVWFLRQVNKIN